MTSHSAGIRSPNGTWNEALGLLQSGTDDKWVDNAFETLERSEDFLYTTPFYISKYGALMKRQTNAFYIESDGLTAGIRVDIYALLAAILIFLLVVSAINERCQRTDERNSIWRILLSTSPMHGQMWKYQTGATRKVLMTTSGFGILILSSLYQAKQAEVLMIPHQPSVVTPSDIE